MPVWKLQVAIAGDSVLARDKAVITPHFNDAGVTTNPQGLCDDLAAAMNTYLGTPLRQIEVTAYDAQGTPPVLPQGYKILNVGSAPASALPREVACCLSFFSGVNRPKYRGRLYLPVYAIGTWGSVSVRPSSPQRDKIGALAPILSNLGGADVDWCVFSRTDGVARSCSNWWVDDEYDTVRSRGLRSTTRTVGTVSDL